MALLRLGEAVISPAIWRIGIALSFGAITYVGFTMLGALAWSFPRPDLTPAEWSLFALAVIAAAHVVLLIHELGHLAGGWIAGYRFEEFTLGLLTVDRRDKLRLRRTRTLRHYGGRVRMRPGGDRATRARHALMLAGGPVASIGAGAAVTLAGIAWLSVPTIAQASYGGFVVAKLCAVIGVGSTVVGLANLIPASFVGGASDGARLLELFTHSGAPAVAEPADR